MILINSCMLLTCVKKFGFLLCQVSEKTYALLAKKAYGVPYREVSLCGLASFI